MNLKLRSACGDGFADFEHVGAENLMPPGREMIGVVFHERGSARQALPHDLHRADQSRCLPVSLAREAIALGHQALRREPRKLSQTMQILERRGEAFEAALFEKSAQAQFEPRAIQ